MQRTGELDGYSPLKYTDGEGPSTGTKEVDASLIAVTGGGHSIKSAFFGQKDSSMSPNTANAPTSRQGVASVMQIYNNVLAGFVVMQSNPQTQVEGRKSTLNFL